MQPDQNINAKSQVATAPEAAQEEMDLYDLNLTNLYSTTCLSSFYYLMKGIASGFSNSSCGFFFNNCANNLVSYDSDDEYQPQAPSSTTHR